jgi:winged helix DNA-binding protein
VRLSARQLNRTLLHRQHLLVRTSASPEDVADRVLGLQGQETLPPYLSLHARVADLDPLAVSRGLEEARWVRLSTMRGTLHLHTAENALWLRPWLQESLDRQLRARAPVEPPRVREVASEILADGPVEQRELADRLAARLPGSASDLWVVARVTMPLVQLPPRGTWGGSGGIVLDDLERWTGGALQEPTTEDVVRRYLRGFGPATAADVGYWSGVSGLRPVVKRMDDLVRHEDEQGRELFDIADGELADEDVHAPVRLLGTYDNVWLSHARRDRVTGPASRGNWMGANGGVACTVFVDGWLTGLWRLVDGEVTVVDLFRELTPPERDELDEEVALLQALFSS